MQLPMVTVDEDLIPTDIVGYCYTRVLHRSATSLRMKPSDMTISRSRYKVIMINRNGCQNAWSWRIGTHDPTELLGPIEYTRKDSWRETFSRATRTHPFPSAFFLFFFCFFLLLTLPSTDKAYSFAFTLVSLGISLEFRHYFP